MSVWFITGASRGFGIEITRQALGRGDVVAATADIPMQSRRRYRARLTPSSSCRST
jgi:NAD(P)-dependent dehydrogenase (short-subunit alcohol dehydrogenase family)